MIAAPEHRHRGAGNERDAVYRDARHQISIRSRPRRRSFHEEVVTELQEQCRTDWLGSRRASLDLVRDMLIISPNGALDSACAAEIDDHLRSRPTVPAVIDLRACVGAEIDVSGFLDPVRWLRTTHQVCASFDRRTARRVLGCDEVDLKVAVFARPEDALQACVPFDAGYGLGWSL